MIYTHRYVILHLTMLYTIHKT